MIAQVDRNGRILKPGPPTDDQKADAIEVISGWGFVLGLGLFLVVSPPWGFCRFVLGACGAGMLGWFLGIQVGLALVILAIRSEDRH